MLRGRLARDVPADGEAFHGLTSVGTTRIEHIVSSDTPDPSVQQQDWDEWVLLLAGRAVLDVDGRSLELSGGDWLLLPAGTPHRVLRTESGTHWLAVHAGATR
jgi:mannose-6-phosphate isomerase-like protein (cupin superfamily)